MPKKNMFLPVILYPLAASCPPMYSPSELLWLQPHVFIQIFWVPGIKLQISQSIVILLVIITSPRTHTYMHAQFLSSCCHDSNCWTNLSAWSSSWFPSFFFRDLGMMLFRADCLSCGVGSLKDTMSSMSSITESHADGMMIWQSHRKATVRMWTYTVGGV